MQTARLSVKATGRLQYGGSFEARTVGSLMACKLVGERVPSLDDADLGAHPCSHDDGDAGAVGDGGRGEE